MRKTADDDGLRPIGALSDIVGANGRRILAELAAGHSSRRILAGLSRPVRRKRELPETVPGVDRGSACAILAELGEDLPAFRPGAPRLHHPARHPGSGKQAAAHVPDLLRDSRPYRGPGVDYESIVAGRKASRWLVKPDRYGYPERIEAESTAALV